MSLYKFFESYLEETPELISINAAQSLEYDSLSSFFKQKYRRSQIDIYMDLLFRETLASNSTNLREYEILKLKTRRLGLLAQSLYH